MKGGNFRGNCDIRIGISPIKLGIFGANWMVSEEIWERGVIRGAQGIVDRYAMTTDHP